MLREIVFDTETTGLNPLSGDKIVEIGAIELINHVRTGKTYHQYINPLRSMSKEVIAVHGLTELFLSDKPIFKEICDDFLTFISSDSKLIAHNASFDMSFLNYELKIAGYEEISTDRVVDTFIIAKKKFPGMRVNLDELCRRFHIDNSARTVHGALLDAELLSDVYLELLGGKEPSFLQTNPIKNSTEENISFINYTPKEARVFEIPTQDLENHLKFIQNLKNPIWLKGEKNVEK